MPFKTLLLNEMNLISGISHERLNAKYLLCFLHFKKKVNKCPFTQNVIHTVALFLWNQGLCFTKEFAAYDQFHQCSFFKTTI